MTFQNACEYDRDILNMKYPGNRVTCYATVRSQNVLRPCYFGEKQIIGGQLNRVNGLNSLYLTYFLFRYKAD